MNKLTKIILVLLWIVISTLILAYLWLQNPAVFFKPPESFSIWIVGFYDVKGAEDIRNLEIIYTIFCSFIVIGTLTFLVEYTYKKVTNCS